MSETNHLPATTQPGVSQHPLMLSGEQWTRLQNFCKDAHASGLLPKNVDSPQKAFVIAIKGHELGLPPMYALERLAVINGKATSDGQVMLALIFSRVPGAVVDPVVSTDTEAEFMMARPGRTPRSFRFTIEDAKRAGLLSKPGPWQQYPRAMLRWRAVSEGAKIVFPDAIAGMMLHEEMGKNVNEDGTIIDAEFTVTPGASNKSVEQKLAAEAKDAASPGKPDAPPPTPMTEEDLATLRAARLEHKWSADDLKKWTRLMYKKDDPTTLTHEECQEAILFIEGHRK